MRQVPFDLDHGDNMIILPYNYTAGMIHCLPVHRSDHQSYDNDVEKGLEKILKTLEKASATDCVNSVKYPRISVFKKLEKMQQEFWKLLVESGDSKRVVSGTVENIDDTTNSVDQYRKSAESSSNESESSDDY